MAAKILEGKPIAEQIKQQVAAEVVALTEAGAPPRLVAVQVGHCPASRLYTNMQAQNCREVGIEYDLQELPDNITEQGLIDRIRQLNQDPDTTGIILQMPLPDHINPRKAQIAISPSKDVEGMHPENMGLLYYGEQIVAPCTALAAVELLQCACPDLSGKEVVVVGHSEIVGKPIATLLLQSRRNSPTVTVCHVATRDLTYHTHRADVVIVATGVVQARWRAHKQARETNPQTGPANLSPLITADMLKEGAIVVDVAINRIPVGFDEAGEPLRNDQGKIAMRTVGDVDFDAACEKAAAITPVPGGVGPLTVAMLLRNTIACAQAMRHS